MSECTWVRANELYMECLDCGDMQSAAWTGSSRPCKGAATVRLPFIKRLVNWLWRADRYCDACYQKADLRVEYSSQERAGIQHVYCKQCWDVSVRVDSMLGTMDFVVFDKRSGMLVEDYSVAVGE